MHLEAEVYGLVLAGFGVVALCTLLALVYLFWRSRHRAILWFGGQLFCLTGAFWFFFRAVNIACAGLFWALSMFCMLFGIYRLLRKGPVIHQF